MRETLEDITQNAESSARGKTLDVVKYAFSYGGATAASYIVGGISSYCLSESGFSPEMNASLSFAAKTAAFYFVNGGIYTGMHWDKYKNKTSSWANDMKEIVCSNWNGTKVTLMGGAFHWGLMRIVSLSPVSSFIIGNLIPGAGAVLVKVARDAKKGIIIRKQT